MPHVLPIATTRKGYSREGCNTAWSSINFVNQLPPFSLSLITASHLYPDTHQDTMPGYNESNSYAALCYPAPQSCCDAYLTCRHGLSVSSCLWLTALLSVLNRFFHPCCLKVSPDTNSSSGNPPAQSSCRWHLPDVAGLMTLAFPVS